MSRIVIAGAGAFGTALALALARSDRNVVLSGRDVGQMQATRQSPRLPGIDIPESIEVTDKPHVTPDDILLLAIPMQSLSSYLTTLEHEPNVAVACCKGIDLRTGLGPTALIGGHLGCPAAILTGPSFADDIARGLPTALTLATKNAPGLQEHLSTETLRLYLSDDPIGAELGGALKNVIAIACGLCIGAGLGESARAALMTRGYAEMQQMAVALGAQPQTLAGLSGFGDLALTCTSTKSRNFMFGHALAQKTTAPNATIEGRATAGAVVELADKHGIDMPIAKTVAQVISGDLALHTAIDQLMNRPLKKE